MNDVVDLLFLQKRTDDDGFDEEVAVTRIQRFANKKAVHSSEFYLASQNGQRAEKVFELWEIDYNDETHLDYEGKRYEIIRIYEKMDKVELTCQRYG